MSTLSVTDIEQRIVMARDILCEIHPSKLKLVNWYTSDHPECGTIACAAGHLALTLKFNELGLYRDTFRGGIYYKETNPRFAVHEPLSGFYALAEVFGFMTLAENIFCNAGSSQWDDKLGDYLQRTYGDKATVLARIDYFLDVLLPVWKQEEARL